MTSLASHLRFYSSRLQWDEKRGLIFKAPQIESPKSAEGDRSRNAGGRSRRGDSSGCSERSVGFAWPASSSERTAAISIGRNDVPTAESGSGYYWLWLLGLRLGEALTLSWDAHAAISVHLAGKYPSLRIWAEAQKAKR